MIDTANTLNSIYTDTMSASQVNGNKLSSKLNSLSTEATDDELMQACKDFEAYMVEQVIKGMEKTIMKDDEENSTSMLDYFGDTMYTEYADMLTENTDLGIAQMLYDSMKRV